MRKDYRTWALFEGHAVVLFKTRHPKSAEARKILINGLEKRWVLASELKPFTPVPCGRGG
jgi:hypothetical protein